MAASDLPHQNIPQHDRPELWSVLPDWTRAVIERDGWQAKPVSNLHQLAISGNIDTARAALAPEAKEVGLSGMVDAEAFLVRLARDYGLLVSRRQIETDGIWQDTGWIATPSDDAYRVIELSGPAVGDVIFEGTSADLHANSPSASVLFAGVPAALYRVDAEIARIHIVAD